MPTRYYLCTLDQHPSIPGVRRPAAHNHLRTGMSTSVAADVTGLKKWCIVCVQARDIADFAGMDADPDCACLTDAWLDAATDQKSAKEAMKLTTASSLKALPKVKLPALDGAKKIADTDDMESVLLTLIKEHHPHVTDVTQMMVGG